MSTRTRRLDRSPVAQDATRDEDTVTVEAPTAEEALAEVSQLLGPDAQIVKAGKVTRGGVGGFFAQEMVQLIAKKQVADSTASAPAASVEPVGAPAADGSLTEAALKASFTEMLERYVSTSGGAGAAASVAARHHIPVSTGARIEAGFNGTVKDRVIREAFAEFNEPKLREPAAPAPNGDVSARTILRPRTADAVPVDDSATARPSPRVVAAGEDHKARSVSRAQPAVPGTGGVDWRQDELVHIGLPFGLIEATSGLDPADDLGWITALAGAVKPFCGPLPDGNSVLVGPRAHHLADVLGLPDVRYPKAPPRATSACLTLPGHKASRAWLLEHRGDRSLHLVVGGAGSKALMDVDADVVSWVGDDGLISALWMSAVRGATLGYGKASKGRVLRADPLDVALAIRALVGRR